MVYMKLNPINNDFPGHQRDVYGYFDTAGAANAVTRYSSLPVYIA